MIQHAPARTTDSPESREGAERPDRTVRFVTRRPPARYLRGWPARSRRVRLLQILLAVGRPLTGRQLADVVRRDPLQAVAWLHSDMLALARLGLVTRHRGMYGLQADYSASLAARRWLRP